VLPIVLKDSSYRGLPEVLRALGEGPGGSEGQAPPISWRAGEPLGGPEQIPGPAELAQNDSEYVRQQLNREAARRLDGGGQEEYREFLEEYEEAINRAWYRPGKVKGKNFLFLGYTLVDELGDGAFGTVYRARPPSGGPDVALKVLKGDVVGEAPMLASFRRGIQSMEILTQAEVEGTVGYLDRAEIPTMVAMELVDGATLSEIVGARAHRRPIFNWGDYLAIAARVSAIRHAAHTLNKKVLHRDVRPPNIMIRDWWQSQGTERLAERMVLLDFDLSWHSDGKHDHSLIADKSLNGFMAPEQFDSARRSDRRTAAVDSFGLGMTLYFMAGGQPPPIHAHRAAAWEDEVASAVRRLGDHPEFRSAAPRLARAILGATRDTQRERLDFPRLHEIVKNLERLTASGIEGDTPRGVCEELLMRATHHDVRLDEARGGFISRSPSGFEFSVSPSLDALNAVARVEWKDSGSEDTGSLNKYVKDKHSTCRGMLEARGWRVAKGSSSAGGNAFSVEADKSIGKIKSRFELEAQQLEEVFQKTSIK